MDGWSEDFAVPYVQMFYDEGHPTQSERGWVIFLGSDHPLVTVYTGSDDRELAMQIAHLVAARHGGVSIDVVGHASR